jgi:hypothetical protein
VELVVVVEVVVVVVSPTTLALFLGGPDVFPHVLVLSDFAFRSPCLSIVVLPAFGWQRLDRFQEFGGFISVCCCLIIFPSWYLSSKLESYGNIILQGKLFGRQTYRPITGYDLKIFFSSA